MFYADLTTYSYRIDGRTFDTFSDLTTGYLYVSFQPPYERVNVGWLDATQPWTRGPVPVAFVHRLQAILAAQAVNVCLGYHDCDLCPDEPHTDQRTSVRPGHVRASIGNGEIRVPAHPGTAFAAPQLIGHYVLDHGYQPPQVFVDAVLAFDPHGPSKPDWAHFPWVPADAEIQDECA